MNTTRKKPVTRVEIRLGDYLLVGDRLRVMAGPADAFGPGGGPIERLWAPLFAELADRAAKLRRKHRKTKPWSGLFSGRAPKGTPLLTPNAKLSLARPPLYTK